jgi:uncharacterized phosphosugar-binding protein
MQAYFDAVEKTLSAIRLQQSTMQRVAEIFAKAIEQDKLIYTFGTGHSALLAEEGLYRAGGLACVSAILEPTTTVAVGMIAGSFYERQQGQARLILDRYDMGSGDVLVAYSNSGANALPVEMALEAKARGAVTVAVSSKAYAAQALVTSGSGQTLIQVCDYVIDNGVPPGDAVVSFANDSYRAASVSTVAGAYIWNTLVAETVRILESKGIHAPLYISSNMPGAKDNNQRLIEKYRRRIKHL